MKVLTRETVVLGVRSLDRFDAICRAGEMLVRSGCVSPEYIDGMRSRERILSTYLGCGIAIPHGEGSHLRFVHYTGVSVVQLPEGVEWGPGERAYLVVGIASKDLQHAVVLTNLVEIIHAPGEIQDLIQAADPMAIVERLTRGRSEVVWS